MSAVDEGTMLRRFFALVAVAVIVGLSAPPARADVVLASDFGPGDTFQTSTGTAWAIGGSQSASAAVAFTIPPGQTYQLTQFRFAANWFAGANTLSVGFFVGSDLNTATLVESFTFSASAFQTPQLFTAVSVVRPLLLPGNTYFIALSVPGAPATQWGWQWNIVGAAGYFARFGSGAWFAETAATTPAFDVSGVPVTGSAVGQVTTSTGTALQGAVVDAFNAATGAFVATTTTNVSGNYSIPLAPGTYKIKAHLNGFLDVFYAIGGLSGIDFTTATPVTVSNTIVTNVNIALPSGGTISGFVHARGTSTPLVGVPVIIFRSAANSFLFRNPSVVTTGSDGSFVFHGLRDGDWIVRVEPQNLGYAISYYSGNADNPATDGSTATPVRIVGANTVSNVNINPAPGGGAIRGRILRSDTLAPVSNLAIQVHFSDAPRTGILPRDSFVAGTSTDGNGQYVFTGLVTGEYIVQAPGIQVVNGTAVAYSNGVASGSGGCSPIFPTGAPQPQTALPVPVTDGFLTDCVNFTVPGFSGGASPRTISGTVRDDAGNPMPFAGVSVEDVVTGYGVAFVVVRGDGSYTVGGLGPRQYHVRTSTTGTSERRWFDDELALAAADVVDVTLGNRIGVDFALPATANTISGKITSADTGKPVMGATVRARGFFNNFYGSDVTQQDGTFLLGGLPAGSYRIDVEAPGFVPRSYTTSGAGGFSSADASLVTVQNGTAAANIDVNMVPATGGGIRGTVTTQQDGPTPVPDALVQIRDAANGSIVAFARTRSDGSFIVPDLGPGQYTLSVFALGFATQWFNGKPTREAADTITVTTGMVSLDQPGVSAFSLSSSQGSISGFVFKADGQTPLEGAGIRIFDAATGGFVSGVGGLTNKNGFYRIASLAPSTAAPGTFLGGYLAQASAPGYASQYFNRATTTATATALTVMNGIDTPNTNFALTQAPELDSISVTSAGRGASGLSLVITGVNLAASASFSFLVNGVNDPCIGISGVTFVNSTQLIVTVAVNACAQLGPHDVMITEPSGTFTLPGALTVTSGPQVLSTNRGSANPLFTNVSTQTVIINGTGFEPPTGSPLSVMFSGTGITVDSVQFTSSSQIAAVVDVAAGAALTPRTVTVVNPDLGTGVSASTIVSLATAPPGAPVGLAPSNSGSTPPAAPALSTLNPSAALLGGSVQLIGTGFSTTLTADSVTFAGSNGSRVPATVMPGATTTQLTVAVPANATDGPVTVAVNGQLSNPLPFAVANPLLSNVLPSSATQGTIVPTLTLKGSKFASNATVTFGGAAGDITFTPSSVVVSPDGTTITIAGVSVSGTAALGARSATVTSAGGSSTLANAFTVTAPQPVTIVASVNGGDPSLFLPSVRAVSVTLDSTGKCIAPKSVTPQPVTLAFTLTPGPGHTVTATSSTMALSMTSTNIPGTATNEDCELGATPTNDFSFDPINPSVQSGSASSLGTGSLTYQATLYSYDWGGSAVVLMSVTALVDGVTQTVTGTLTVPVDTDTDGLPDAYEKDRTLGANAVGSTPLDFQNAHQNGNANLLDGQARFARDGLSNFAKYRGVYLAGPGPGRSGSMTNQIRLEVGQRHLFAWGRGFGTDPVVKAAPTPSCGVTVDPTTGVVGGPAPDPTLSPTNPCPPFEVGGAFAAINVKVHDVSASFSAPAGATVFPTQSLVTPATPILDLAIVKYDATNCYSGEACAHTSKVGVRNWTFPSLGFSAYGTSTAYGSDIRVFKIPVDAYFADKPYLHQTNLASAIIVAPDGKPMLAPITLVCDSSSKGADNGAADGNECTVGGQLGGDTYVPGSFSRDLSAMAAANDGCTQLPFVSDPRAVQRCGPPGSSTDLTGPQGPYPSATKRQVVRHLITHELGHGAGVNLHTTDSTDVMYQYTNNWIRDGFNGVGHFSTTAAPLIQIHNGGLQ